MNEDFKFLVINAKNGWKKVHNKNLKNLEVSDEGITLKTKLSYVRGGTPITSKGWETVSDLAVDECGIIYILDSIKHRVFIYDHLKGITEPLEHVGIGGDLDNEFKSNKIALGNNTVFIADTRNNQILCFSRPEWKLKRTFDNINPHDMVVDNSEDVYVLDKNNGRILKFDVEGNSIEILRDEEVKNAENMSIDNQGFLYVLYAVKKKISKFKIQKNRGQLETEIDMENIIMEPSGFVIDSMGNIYVGDKKGQIHKFHPSRNSAGYLSGYNDSCAGIYIDRWDNLYVITEKNDIIFLKPEKQYSIRKHDTFIHGTFIHRFNSDELGCNWHKIGLNAAIPEKTEIQIFYYISDNESLPKNSWKKLATFGSSELKYHDALIKNCSGKYLWLKLELVSSDKTKTPKITRIKAYFPRISYLRYLPSIYQENESSKDFLQRFLALFENIVNYREEEISKIARYFDFESTPDSFLPWLASWIGTVLDDNWSKEKQREFLLKAVELYKQRGTRRGIKKIIEIYTDAVPIIIENWQLYQLDEFGDWRLKCEDKKSESCFFNLEEVMDNNLDDLRIFLEYYFDICEVSGIITNKKEDSETQIVLYNEYEEDIGEISIQRDLKKALLMIYNGKNHYLKVKEENGEINIYAKEFFENLFGEPNPYKFFVFLKPQHEQFKDHLKAVKRIIELEKPAHTSAEVSILEPGVYLDMHSYLEINTYLSKPVTRLDTGSFMGRNSALMEIKNER